MIEQAHPDYNADMEDLRTATRMAQAVADDYKRKLDEMRTATAALVHEALNPSHEHWMDWVERLRVAALRTDGAAGER